MTRCPDLTPGNYFFGDEPVPALDESVLIINGSQCGNAVITFRPQSAPAGTMLNISLDGFTPKETVEACWYFPSNALENCLELMTDADGNVETVYLSSTNYPRGIYRMEVEDTCGQYSQEFCLD